jgi:CopG-like RHH_1 or ribbon-helix-helix domain, RHH_5
METATMPKTKAQAKTRIELYLPEPIYEEIQRIANADGWSQAELYRLLMVDGLAAYAEKSNKRLINEQLRAKLHKDEQSSQSEE